MKSIKAWMRRQYKRLIREDRFIEGVKDIHIPPNIQQIAEFNKAVMDRLRMIATERERHIILTGRKI